MKGLLISRNDLNSWIKSLAEKYKTFAPVRTESYDQFSMITSPEEINWAYRKTRLSPKALFHPHSEKMFQFSLDPRDPSKNILKEAPKDFSPRVIVGIRPCDAYALKLVDLNFDTSQYKDPWWTKRREITTLIGLACTSPGLTCFCKAVGTGPFDTRGVDILLVPLEDAFLLEIITEKGQILVEKYNPGGQEPPPEVLNNVEKLKSQAESAISSFGNLELLSENSVSDFFDAPLWNEVQFGCINCGTCTFLCPTCWCFDIQDEVYRDKGCRLRLWDSCMFPLFTLHGSGHNPRAQKVQRVRQRFMHKLKYFVDKYRQGVACVGCGRCVEFCPVNIDIRDIIRRMISLSECAV